LEYRLFLYVDQGVLDAFMPKEIHDVEDYLWFGGKALWPSSEERLNLDNLRWRGAAKVRMHVALCYSVILAAAITAHKMERLEPAHSIKAFQKPKKFLKGYAH